MEPAKRMNPGIGHANPRRVRRSQPPGAVLSQLTQLIVSAAGGASQFLRDGKADGSLAALPKTLWRGRPRLRVAAASRRQFLVHAPGRCRNPQARTPAPRARRVQKVRCAHQLSIIKKALVGIEL